MIGEIYRSARLMEIFLLRYGYERINGEVYKGYEDRGGRGFSGD
jgi:hypothetical protein